MKKTLIRLALMAMALVLVFTQFAFAEPSDNVKNVYTAMTSENSEFSETQALYANYYDNVKLEAALEDDGIAITLTSENEYVDSGAWKFTEDGDELVVTMNAQDYYGASMVQYIMLAAADVQGMNNTLYNGYVSGMAMSEQENPYLKWTADENAGTMTYRINIAGPYDLTGLEDLVLTEDVLKAQGWEPLTADYISTVINYGQVSLLVNGNADGATILVMEYNALDNLAYEAAVAAAKTLQPSGWEDFCGAFTSLMDVQGDNYSAMIDADADAVREIIDDVPEDYHFAIIRIGQPGDGYEEEDYAGYQLDDFSDTTWQSGDLTLESVWQDGYYKIVIMEGDTERSYLCDVGEASGYLFALGTGVAEFDADQDDYGRGIFLINDDGNLVWQKPNAEEVVFVRAE